jgi:hypothetical protein
MWFDWMFVPQPQVVSLDALNDRGSRPGLNAGKGQGRNDRLRLGICQATARDLIACGTPKFLTGCPP